MNKILLSIFLFFLLFPQTVFSGASPTVLFPETLMWRHIIEQGDLLLIARYELEANGTQTSTCGVSTDWDDCQVTDTFIDLLGEDGTTLIERDNLPFLGAGLGGFYLTADEVTASIIDFSNPAQDEPVISIYSSPTLFTPNITITRNPAIQPTSTATLEESRDDLALQLLRLIKDEIQDKHTDTDLTNPYTFTANELVEDGKITLEGRRFATAITPLLVPILPYIFQLAGSLLTEQIGYTYQSFLSTNAIAGATTLTLVRTAPFAAGQALLIRDIANSEIVEVISIDSNVQITIDTDPDIVGNQGLANGYTTANLANVTITAFADYGGTNNTKTNLENLLNYFGIGNWVGGLLFLTLTVLGVAAIGGTFSGSWVGGLGILPIILLIGSGAGIINAGLLFVVALFMLLGGGIMYAKGLGR